MRDLTSGGLWIAEEADDPVGALVVGNAPPYVDPVLEPELYVLLLLTSRRHAGKGYGATLLGHARTLARERGAGLLRVDCWAGAPALVAWYERHGFARAGTYEAQGWSGQVLAQRLNR